MVSVRELHKTTAIPERTLRDWKAKGILNLDEDLPTAVQGVIRYYKDLYEEARASSAAEDELEAQKIRLTRAQADKCELELKRQEEELIDRTTAIQAWSKLVAAFRAKMLGLPPKAAPQIIVMGSAAEAEALLTDFIHEALEELSEYGSE